MNNKGDWSLKDGAIIPEGMEGESNGLQTDSLSRKPRRANSRCCAGTPAFESCFRDTLNTKFSTGMWLESVTRRATFSTTPCPRHGINIITAHSNWSDLQVRNANRSNRGDLNVNPSRLVTSYKITFHKTSPICRIKRRRMTYLLDVGVKVCNGGMDVLPQIRVTSPLHRNIEVPSPFESFCTESRMHLSTIRYTTPPTRTFYNKRNNAHHSLGSQATV